MIRVCSGFSPAGRANYGERFLRSFDRHWPQEVELQVYVEEPMAMPRDARRSLWGIEGALHFHHRHKDDLSAQGRVPRPGWKRREIEGGYSFRHDAMKFWKQILIPQEASRTLHDGDILVWLDADVDTIAPVPLDFVPGLLAKADLVYLGRDRSHSEIGFWAIRMSDKARQFLGAIAECYKSDAVFELPEWHSAFVWDYVRRTFGFRERNLTPGGHGHVWPRSVLARYMRHDKGPRKPGGNT